MIRPAMLALSILCASAIGAAQAQQHPSQGHQQGSQQQQGQPAQQGQNQQGSQQKPSGQPQQPLQDAVPKDALERAFYHASKLKSLLEKLGEMLAVQLADAGHLPPELASSVCDVAQQVAQLDASLTSDIYHAAIDQLQRSGDLANKAAEDALEGAEENVRALIKAKVGWSFSDEPQPPADSNCPEFPPDYKPPETPPALPRVETEPPERRMGDKPGELRPTDQVMVRRETGRPSTPIELIPAPSPVTVATDRVQWCTFGSARGIATRLTPTDADGKSISRGAPTTASMTAERTPGASNGPPAAPEIAGRPRKIATPSTALVRPHTWSAPRPGMSDNPSPAGKPESARTPKQPNTSEQTPPASPSSPTPLDTRNPSTGGQLPSVGAPEQPKTTEPTPTATGNAPPTGDLLPTSAQQVTIDFNEKVNIKEVAENAKVATAEPAAALKLKSVAPDLPGSGNKSAQDRGFDKDPASGRMSPDGQLRITTNEPQAYGLASGPGAPTHYRAEIDTPEHSGFVAETTGKPVKPAALASAVPAGVKATIDTVQFGGLIHTRVGLDWPRSQQLDPTALAASIGQAIGAKLGIDTCRRTKPAPDLESTSLRAIGSALPAAIIKLRRAVASGSGR